MEMSDVKNLRLLIHQRVENPARILQEAPMTPSQTESNHQTGKISENLRESQRVSKNPESETRQKTRGGSPSDPREILIKDATTTSAKES